MVLHSTEAKTEAHSLASQTSPGLNGEGFLFLTGWRMDPDPAALWPGSQVSPGGSYTRPFGADAFISHCMHLRAKGRPDGICPKKYYSTDQVHVSPWSYLNRKKLRAVSDTLLTMNFKQWFPTIAHIWGILMYALLSFLCRVQSKSSVSLYCLHWTTASHRE